MIMVAHVCPGYSLKRDGHRNPRADLEITWSYRVLQALENEIVRSLTHENMTG